LKHDDGRPVMLAEPAMMIAVAALVLSAVAYWRTGGRGDVESALHYLRSKVEALGMKELELARKIHESSRKAYERTRQGIVRARARRAEVRGQTPAGRDQHHEMAAERRPERAVEQHLADLSLPAVPAARSADHAASSRARTLEARADVLILKAHLLRAKSAAESGELDRAESLLRRAIATLEEARTILGADDTHVPEIEEGVRTLIDAIAAARGKAEDAGRRIDEILVGSDSLVASLEGTENDAGHVVLLEAPSFVAPAEGTITLTNDSIGSPQLARQAAAL
jgi:hypothetical protein